MELKVIYLKLIHSLSPLNIINNYSSLVLKTVTKARAPVAKERAPIAKARALLLRSVPLLPGSVDCCTRDK